MKRDPSGLVARIDALLPQTQCRQCGHSGCLPYAEAIAAGGADINQCPPGGDELTHELASLLGVAAKPVDAQYGVTRAQAVACIDEALCIGCTLCIQACPVDAIVGAAKLMHTIIVRDCTGCGLCLPPCPVDCIAMTETGARPTRSERRNAAARARARYERRTSRLARIPRTERTPQRNAKQETVERAIARAKLRLAQRRPPHG